MSNQKTSTQGRRIRINHGTKSCWKFIDAIPQLMLGQKRIIIEFKLEAKKTPFTCYNHNPFIQTKSRAKQYINQSICLISSRF